MPALLVPDPAPAARLDPALVHAFGLVACPLCGGTGVELVTLQPDEPEFETCGVCDGAGVVTGDRREDEAA